jgi:type IV secretion system protein VirB6
MGLLCTYTMFLVALSSVALAVLLALGPLFITLVLFEATQRFFQAWLAQLATYALISVLTVLMASLLLQIVESYAQQTAARGAAIVTVDALDMVLVAVLVFLLMRQVMPIAGGLAGGVALTSFGLVSGFVRWGQRQGGAAAAGLRRLGIEAARASAPASAPVPAVVERDWSQP